MTLMTTDGLFKKLLQYLIDRNDYIDSLEINLRSNNYNILA